MLKLPKSFDRTNGLVAVGVLLATLIVYIRTLAPTLSFWDCGEFIATSYILGIPHPPGTPTYVLFGRVASMLPTFVDICARVNFLSGLCSALAVMFGYLFGVRLLRYWFTDARSLYSRFLTYAGAATGAFFMAFSLTQWNNSVEAEVYGMSMMITFIIAWLATIYFENRATIAGNKIMLLMVYLAFLGIGVHMSTFLVIPITILFFILKKDTPVKYWFMLAGFFAVELYLIFALSSRPNEVPYFIPVLMTFFFFLAFMLSFERIGWQLLAAGGGFLVASLPALAAVFGLESSVWELVGVVGYVVLIVFGVYLLLSHFRAARDDDDGGRSQSLIAGAFILVSALLTALLKLGLENGPFGYKIFLLMTVGLAVALGLVLWKYIRLPILLALAGPSMIMLGVREFFWGSVIAAGAILLLAFIWKTSGWKTALLVLMMATMGYSTHLFAPVRSSLNPYIDENSPGDSLDATINFFERKQYGSQSMTERMFKRRAEWVNQFGDHVRMGFWGFFAEQYGITGRTFIVLFLLGLFGAWEASRRRPELGLYLVTLLLVTTAGLVLYMNFADGTRQTAVDAWLEVRDRDYFFTPGFMFFGLAIGLGMTALIQLLRDLTERFGPGPKKIVLAVAPVIFLTPAFALTENYNQCDRSDNYIPYDYAYNILQSAEPNGVIFTFGDNDTFPLWCLQEVYGVRKDLKLICCALSNGGWYIKQVRDNMGLDLGWTDEDIDNLRPFRTPDGITFRIQDQVVDAVVAHNIKKYPIHYSLLAYEGARRLFGQNVDSMMELSGLTYRLTDSVSSQGLRVDVDRHLAMMMDSGLFQYRGWTDPDIFQSITTQRSLRGVAEHFIIVVEQLLKAGRVDEGTRMLYFLVDSVYASKQTITILADLLSEQGDTTRVAELIAAKPLLGEVDGRMILANAHLKAGNHDAAVGMMSALLTEDPANRQVLNELMRILIGDQDIEGMLAALETWLVHNPNDREIRQALADLRGQLEAVQDSGGATP